MGDGSAYEFLSFEASGLVERLSEPTISRARILQLRIAELKQVGGLMSMAQKLDYPSFSDYINQIQVQAETIAANMRAIQEEL